MTKTALGAILLLVVSLCGCSAVARQGSGTSACSAGEATYACQLERYGKVGMP